jgi:hypothetical protein
MREQFAHQIVVDEENSIRGHRLGWRLLFAPNGSVIWLRPGAVIEMGISSLGTQQNRTLGR